MNTLQTPLIITSFSSKVDGSLRLSACTPELSSEEKALFMELQNMNLEATFKPTEIKSDVKEIRGEFDTKTPSQRLRNVIYVFWEQRGARGDFDSFYLRQMNKLIERVKSELNQ